ncbi:hypothetical protein CIW48_22730 [Methylobacterium sp. P1-11]|uniref:hypothetical protein n=1 Tax=Methylobacterium sp. P1-11 TaxID=2024616 RepID=UPI0011F073F1|nr:hypothetical protein [Methylobacterium sp. P1-11]KAA0121615.1 hypothetical protein CIW48_22730 [Methylobacterium sp. P1-11]
MSLAVTIEACRSSRRGLLPGWRAAFLALSLIGPGDLTFVSVARAAAFDCAAARGRIETLVCADPGLSKLDDELKALFDQIEGETRGTDGETGKRIDAFGEDHARWRERVRDACADTACLRQVYAARIEQARRDWRQTLPVASASGTPALRHYVNVRFGFSVDVPAELVAERAPDNGDGQAFHSAEGGLQLTVWGSNNALGQTLEAFVADDHARCQRQPAAYLRRKAHWIVLSCATGEDTLYQKTIRSGGSGAFFVSVRLRYPASEQARWQGAVATASSSLRLIPIDRDLR